MKKPLRTRLQALFRALDPLPENLFREPLEYLRADHFRLSASMDLLKETVRTNGAGDLVDGETAPVVIDFLESDLLHHLSDEEQDLLPLLRHHMDNESPLNDMFDLLGEIHDRQRAICGEIVSDLRLGLASGALSNARRFWKSVGGFGEILRWTIAAEERILIKMARDRLPDQQLKGMGRAMAARRHAAYPE